jgi:hypothetical protein
MGYVPFSLLRPIGGGSVHLTTAIPTTSVMSATMATPITTMPTIPMGWFSDFVHSQI